MVWLFGKLECVDDGTCVFAFEPAVGGDGTAAIAMIARIHHHDAVPVLQKEFGLADNADAVVGDSMKQQDPGAVWICGTDFPATQKNAIRGANGEVFAVAFGMREAGVGFSYEIRGER